MFLQIKDLSFKYDTTNVIDDINFNVSKGEFVTLLGPSGCGKTTILNLISGILNIQKGKIILDSEEIQNLPIEKRMTSTVFQSYALFPNMNVIENVAYGIRYFRKFSKSKSLDMAKDYLKMVELDGFKKRKISELSGGQRQRVALARGIATNPKILLLDEPLSNLDAKLRLQMREMIKDIQTKNKLTMIFVTHDQEEALSMSDKIIVLEQGKIAQIGSPKQIYSEPKNEYVANFIGEANFIYENGIKYLVRPQDIKIIPLQEKNDKNKYEIISKSYLGIHTSIILKNIDNEEKFKVYSQNDDVNIGDIVNIEISKSAVIEK